MIAHSVSVMVIQAGGARLVMGSDPARAEGSLRSVERAGRDALAEMRRLLGVLDAHKDPRALAPQPRLADVEDLVVRTRAAGLATDLRIEGERWPSRPRSTCAPTGSSRRRSRTRSSTRGRPRSACVCAGRAKCWSSRSPTTAGARLLEAPSGGHGIAGMRERAGLHGGSVHAGAGADGGFAVRARLPLVGALR